MITPAEIMEKLERYYKAFLQAWVRGEVFFPLSLPVGQIPRKDFLALRQSIEALRDSSKEKLGYGYTIVWKQVNVRGTGPQTLPSTIIIESDFDYLRLLKKKREVDDFASDVSLIRAQMPELEAWIAANPLQVIRHHGHWEKLLAVCQYFQASPSPKLYLRELPVPVHTKYIEEYQSLLRQLLDCLLPADAINHAESDFVRRYGLREKEMSVRFRLLDETMLTTLHLPFDELAVPTSQFAAFDLSAYRCVIVENEMSFLTLPAIHHAFGIFGSGFAVVDNLVKVRWLANCPICYWGDLDAQGFQILSMLRGVFPQVISLMMDQQTFTRFPDRVREGTTSKLLELPYLTIQEYAVYELLVHENQRLEQEQIDFRYVVEQFQTHFK